MANKRDMNDEPVAAVCGKQVRIYGPSDKNHPRMLRPLRSVHEFPHYGAAKLYADEFEMPLHERVNLNAAK